ncbi:MAG: MFS transporter [Candidatus Hermodarchaeota archaeon]
MNTRSSDSNKAIWIAGLATLLAAFQLTIINTYVVIFLQEDLLTAIIIITIIISLRNLLQIFLRVPLGELSQIIGRKPLLLLGHFSFTLALIFLFFAFDWFFVFLSIIFVAFGMSCFWPSLFAYVSDFTPKTFGHSNGRIFQMGDVGTIFGSLISSLLLDELLWGLRNLFGIIAGIGVFSGVITIFLLPEGLIAKDRRQVDSILQAIKESIIFMARSFKNITMSNHLAEVYAFQFFLSFIEFAAATFLPVLIVSKGYTRGEVAEIVFWSTIAIIWFKPYLGQITDKFNFIPTISSFLIISSLTMLVFLIIQTYWLLVLVYIILNGSLITSYIAANGETARRASFEQRGTALGALGVYVSFGRTTSTIVLGPVWEVFGLFGVFLLTGFGVLIIAALLFFFMRYRTSKRQN